MRTFKEFMMSAEQPPTKLMQKEKITPEQKSLLQNDLNTGALSQDDFEDIRKMLDSGWRFDDALSVAKNQANKRKYQQKIQKPMP